MEDGGNIELIDRFLKNELSDVDKIDFMERLNKEPSLKSDFEFMLLLKDAALNIEGEDLKDKLFKPQTPIITIIKKVGKYVMPLAAAVFIFIIWQPGKYSNEKIFSTYKNDFLDYSYDYLGNEQELVDSLGHLRGNEQFQNFPIDIQNKLQLGIDNFNSQDYIKAREYFLQVPITIDSTPDIYILLSISRIYTGEIEIGIKELRQLSKSEIETITDKAKFFLGLAYLKVGKRSDARKIFKELKAQEGYYKDEAKDVLSRMRWF